MSSWLVVGDFNVIKTMMESSEYFQGMPSPSPTLEFQKCLRDLEFLDMPHSGPFFTWTNKRTVDLVAKKLDRILVNTYWLHAFPEVTAEFLPLELSDYCAGRLFSNCTMKRVGQFKFFNFLIRHKDFLTTIQNSWSSTQPFSTLTYQFCKKPKALKNHLHTMCRSSYSNIQSRVTVARDRDQDTQLQVLNYPSDALAQLEKSQALYLAELLQLRLHSKSKSPG